MSGEQGLETGVKMDMRGLVDYQEGSVVSRTLVDRDSGTVTIFAFDRGQGLSEHTAPFDALVYVLEGEAEMDIGGEGHTLVAGETIVMPADVPHAVRAVEALKMLLVMMR